MDCAGTYNDGCISCAAISRIAWTGYARDGSRASGARCAPEPAAPDQRVPVEMRIGNSLNPAIRLAASLIHGACFSANRATEPAALPACVTLHIGEGWAPNSRL